MFNGIKLLLKQAIRFSKFVSRNELDPRVIKNSIEEARFVIVAQEVSYGMGKSKEGTVIGMCTRATNRDGKSLEGPKDWYLDIMCVAGQSNSTHSGHALLQSMSLYLFEHRRPSLQRSGKADACNVPNTCQV